MWDQHMHCMFSGDSDADPVLMIKSAINKGLDGICFTDHLDYDYKEEPGLFDLDIAAYEKRIKRLAIVLKEKDCPVNIHWGIEIGLQPHITDKNNEVTKKYPFDLVIGSSHVVNGIDPYYPAFYKGKTEHEAYTLNRYLTICTAERILMCTVTSTTWSDTVLTKINTIHMKSMPT